jgi:ribosomal protein S16
MKSIYFDENHKVDEAGAALIKAVGIYSPGSYVRLQSDEVAIVVRRGANTTTPLAAVILNRKGMPQAELTVRDTVQPEFKVIASIPYDGVRVKPNFKRLLPLTLRNNVSN